jgi:hypothetical protein
MGEVSKVDIEALYAGVPLEASRDEPLQQVEALVLGRVEAYLIDPRGDLIEAAELSWTKDGAAVTAADLHETTELPQALAEDGKLVATDLPLGRYAVTPTVVDGPEYAAAQVAWVSNKRDYGRPHMQRVRYASRPQPADESEEREEEDMLGCLHAALVDRKGKVVGDVPCAWWINGEETADGRLPTTLPADGVIKVEDLPPAVYAVEPRPEGEGAPRYKPARLAWTEELAEEPLYQRLRLA